ncbi:MAG: DUF1028 domain-containing protein [Jatrophihabitans sp.]|nr:MAG: DUF1028 domain-containing protein [Jatrophihabitans sp.]
MRSGERPGATVADVTFSIVARSDDGTSWGVAVASKFLAVGNAVPAARAGAGALATQAGANVSWKHSGLELLARGTPAGETLRLLVDADPGRAERQLGVVDAAGAAATYTGSGCLAWAGGLAETGVAIQGNILAGPQVVEAMKDAWDASGQNPLARRLLAALAAGDAAGGDRRGRQSAALLVVREGAGYGGFDDVAVGLRVDDHVAPVGELARLLDLNDFYLAPPPDRDRLPVGPDLAAELDRRARDLGHADFPAWVGTENYEMRVADDLSWIDRRVLELLRAARGRGGAG